jgi:hypothetical protein
MNTNIASAWNILSGWFRRERLLITVYISRATSVSEKMPPVYGALMEKTVYSLTLGTTRFKLQNPSFAYTV